MKLFVLGWLCFLMSGVINAQSANGGCKVELYLLKKTFIPQSDMDDPLGYFMPQSSDLSEQPLLVDEDILGYGLQPDSTKPFYFDLRKAAIVKVDSVIKKLPLYGQAFAITINGDPVFGAYFWSHSSSYVCTWLTAFAVSDRVGIYPGYDDSGHHDPRQNVQLLDCLRRSGRLKEAARAK